MKYISLDIGEKSIGIAGSNSGQLVLSLAIIKTNGWQETKSKVMDIIDEYHPKELIVGLPLDSSSQINKQSEIIKNIFLNMQNLKIKYINEAYSTKQAILLTKRKSGQKVDDLCAKIILEQYLNENKI